MRKNYLLAGILAYICLTNMTACSEAAALEPEWKMEAPDNARSDAIFSVSGGEQYWSDIIVDASVCNINGNVYYTWDYVMSNKANICSGKWSLPSKTDFMRLDTLLGGTGNRDQTAVHAYKYLEVFGGQYSGYVVGNCVLQDGELSGNYWSSTEASGTQAYYLTFTNRRVDPQETGLKDHGLLVRCVQYLKE
jgi:uncharacterized protein (TIGR02145 family)